MRPEFTSFPKIPRLNRGCCITEKIDGTNAQIVVTAEGEVFAGSRSRWITPEQDNFGFAAWVKANEDKLRRLGPGQHFGEWWGAGIQRRYGLSEKRFSLFNTGRWLDGEFYDPETKLVHGVCHVVPVLAVGNFSTDLVNEALAKLRECGSIAAPGFMQPEGVVVYLSASGALHKVLLEGDERPKGAQAEVAA